MNLQSVVLPNGLTSVVQRLEHSGVVAVWMGYRCGSASDPDRLSGLAHLLEHLTFTSLGDALADIGAHFNGYTRLDYTCYQTVVPTTRLKEALSVERRRMGGLSWGEGDFTKAMSAICAEVEGRVRNPDWLLSAELMSRLHGGGGYGRPVIGICEDLERVALSDVTAHYKKWYMPRHAVVVLAGAIDPDIAFAEIERMFADMPQGAAVCTEAVFNRGPAASGEPLSVKYRGAPRFHRIYRVPAASDADANGIPFVQMLLGGSNPWSQRVWPPAYAGKVIKEGLLGSISVRWEITRGPGALHVLGAISTPSGCRDVDSCLDALSDYFSAVPEQQIEIVTKQIRSDILSSFEATRSAAGLIGRSLMTGWRAVPEAPQPSEVTGAWQKYLSRNNGITGWLVPHALEHQ